MARKTPIRGTSPKPQETATLIWLAGGALGVAAIILGMTALTRSSAETQTKASTAVTVDDTKAAKPTQNNNLPSPVQSTAQNQGHTQKISQRPALVQPSRVAPRTQEEPETQTPVEPPQSALAAYFYDLQVHRTDRDEYVQGLMDSEVTWVGYIKKVENREIGPTLLLAAVPSNNTFDIAYIDFPKGKGFEDKLSALATLDKVQIKGFYRGGGPMPHVDGRSVELVEE